MTEGWDMARGCLPETLVHCGSPPCATPASWFSIALYGHKHLRVLKDAGVFFLRAPAVGHAPAHLQHEFINVIAMPGVLVAAIRDSRQRIHGFQFGQSISDDDCVFFR